MREVSGKFEICVYFQNEANPAVESSGVAPPLVARRPRPKPRLVAWVLTQTCMRWYFDSKCGCVARIF